jgi:acetyl esterase/lipase
MKNKMMIRQLLLCGLLLSLYVTSSSQEILLWPKGAPGSEGKSGPEKVRVTEGGDHVISGIHNPSITPYLPAAGKATGAAIIIAPGGGHRELWSDHEGHNPARWLSEQGIAAFVLKYRLAKEEGSTYTVDEHEVGDMKQALSIVRSRAKEWGIDTARIGVMGFSAGGEVAALTAMQNPRPAFQALIYPGNSARFEVSKASPPVFIVCGYNDRIDIAKGMADLYSKYKEAGVPAELHVYAKAGHGFGMRSTNHDASSKWLQRLVEWMTDMEWLKK